MLVLTRKPGEKVLIGTDITLTVVEIKGDRVKLGIDAPDQVTILREELLTSMGADCPSDDFACNNGALVGST